MKINETAVVISQEMIATDIYSLIIKTNAADYAVPGQFMSLYCNDASRKLPRPISICGIDKAEKTIRMVYRVAGKGTKEFTSLVKGDEIHVLGPLGNGFPLEGKNPIVVGGGIGVPPMLELAKQLKANGAKVGVVMGYRNAQTFLSKEFEEVCSEDFYIATDDGSVGTHGTVVDSIINNRLEPDVIYACGPKPMLKALAAFAEEKGIKCYISMEERMACGIGACLGCVCQSKEVDDHSHVNNKRVCKDGPVFLSTEVEL